MSRARNIKPKFFKNEDLVVLPFATRLLFIGLWTEADREGRLEDRPMRLKMELFPADNIDINAALQQLHDAKFLVRYQNNEGSFIQITKFSKHQSPHYSEKASVIKPPDSESTPRPPPEISPLKRGGQPPDSLNPDSLNPDSLNPDSLNPDSLNPESGGKAKARAKRSPRPPAPGFGEFWNAYPKKVGRQEAEAQWNLLAPDEGLRITIMAALEEQKQSRQWSDPKFIKDPERWIKKRRWEDEVPRETNQPGIDQWLDDQQGRLAQL